MSQPNRLLHQAFYRQLDERVAQFPSLKEITDLSWDHLVSPHTLQLPKSIYAKVENAIRILYRLSRGSAYREQIRFSSQFPFPVRGDSILMAYDFHTTESGGAHLVEINTNASGFLISSLVNAVHRGIPVLNSAPLAELKISFEMEAQRSDQDNASKPNIAIVDDDLPSQRMLLEFLMYRDLIQSWGWSAEIAEAAALQMNDDLSLNAKKIDFVYNRSTDFYFEELGHAAIKTAWEKQLAVVSPQPTEYFLLADKQRLTDFTKPEWLVQAGASPSDSAAIHEVLIPTFQIQDFSSTEAIWTQRKSLFFKPKRSFGGKSVYRGESVSRKVFERLMAEDILIQKFTPAQRFLGHGPEDPLGHWKFDVRFYVFQDRIQQVVGRLYQGQVTNFSTPFGGFTPIDFV